MRKKDNDFDLSKEEKKKSVESLRAYLSENFDMEAGNLQTEMLLDFITKNVGIFYYNKGVSDSMAALSEKVEDLFLLMKEEV